RRQRRRDRAGARRRADRVPQLALVPVRQRADRRRRRGRRLAHAGRRSRPSTAARLRRRRALDARPGRARRRLRASGHARLGLGGLATRLMNRVPARALITPGLLLVATGMLLLTRLQVGSNYATHVLPPELLLGVGMGLIFVPAITTATRGVDQREAGIASAV